MFERAIANLRPRPRIRLLDWCRENVQTDHGRPYDHMAYPHLGAPGGPMDAFDCPQYLTIWLQWASRLGKSFFGQCALMKTAACDPCPMMFASADQKLGVEVTARTYRMIDRCPPLRDQLRPPSRRKQDLVELGDCRVFVSWARSVSTLADKAVRVGHANEIDKWEHVSTSKEADPLKLFSDRFKEFPSHKKIFESTPALKQASRIERGRLASTNCQYWVPCPQCWRYQLLTMDRVRWEKNEAGTSDKDLARRTARYVCQHCEAELRDEHRGPMMRHGVWVPEGCGVDDAVAREAAEQWRASGLPMWRGWAESPWITGIPARDGRDAGYQLSSLYALQLSWGRIAEEWCDSQRNTQNLRNFINQWLAETWEHIKRRATWEQIGAKLIAAELPRFVVPSWASLLTMGVDRQEDDRYPWMIVAWGPGRRCAAIAYGECESLAEVEATLLGRAYSNQDNGPPHRLAFTLVDSGFRPEGIYEFCLACVRKQVQVWPSKGSSQSLDAEYREAVLGQNTSMPGMKLFHIDTIRTQLWAEKVIHTLQPTDEGGFCLHSGSLVEHQDCLEQLLNDAAVADVDSHNNARESWERVNQHMPNDFRDCLRNAYAAMLIATRGRPIAERKAQQQPAKRPVVISSGETRPDGRRW